MTSGFDYYLRRCRRCNCLYRTMQKRSKVCKDCNQSKAWRDRRLDCE
jgi:hypothetical protein